ncbi:MAG UNVERIFIED_CONTAM: substrate-binding domain-containing protein [Anaerolineae bacterium]
MGIKVPRELSIVGFDDSDVREHTYPSCTAVVQDARWMGLESSRWLSRLTGGVDDTPPVMQMVRHTRFEINHTTCPRRRRRCGCCPTECDCRWNCRISKSSADPRLGGGQSAIKETAVR